MPTGWSSEYLEIYNLASSSRLQGVYWKPNEIGHCAPAGDLKGGAKDLGTYKFRHDAEISPDSRNEGLEGKGQKWNREKGEGIAKKRMLAAGVGKGLKSTENKACERHRTPGFHVMTQQFARVYFYSQVIVV